MSIISKAGDVKGSNKQESISRQGKDCITKVSNVHGSNTQKTSTSGTSINIAENVEGDNMQQSCGNEESGSIVGDVGGSNTQRCEDFDMVATSDADHNRQCEHAADSQQPQMMSGTVNVPVEANRQNVSAGAPLANENQDHPLSQMGQDENLPGDEAGDGEDFGGNGDDSHQRQDVVNPEHLQEVGDPANEDIDVNRQTIPVANGSQDREEVQMDQKEADEEGVKDLRTDQRQTFYGLLYALVSPFFYVKKKIVSFVIQWWSAD